jgi:uncharacterized protein
MKIKVSEIPEEGLDIDAEEALEADDSGAVSKARLNLRVEKSGADVFVSGKISARVSLSCSRCLKHLGRDLSVPVNLAYSPADAVSEEAHELSPDELNTGFYRDDEIDLGEVSREQVLLNVPMKPLCSDACKGICPKCGADLNEKDCGCDLGRVDHRFQILEKFLKKGKE